ncbi:MAG: enoyl-CoA hydratase/isomerase family protein [Pararobbsia sp.]
MTSPATGSPRQAVTSADATIVFRQVNRVAILTLNRPAALNALDLHMIRELAGYLEHCRADPDVAAVVLNSSIEKAFCAGGDVRAIYRTAIDAPHDVAQFFIEEYRLDLAIHRFAKPVVTIMDGITMGGGMGLAQGAALRIATERSRLAMPETRLGLVPDVGATHFLGAMPIETELYVGLTGAVLGGPDAVQCGLADVCVQSASLAGFEQRLEALDLDTARPSPDPRRAPMNLLTALRDVFAHEPLDTRDAPITTRQPWITQHFPAGRSVPEIVASLREARDGMRAGRAIVLPAFAAAGIPTQQDAHHETPHAWLTATLDALLTCSPTLLAVTREALLRGRHMSLPDCFRMELGIILRAIEMNDFREGVRAHLIDKDRQPQWQPATLEAVTAAHVDTFMQPRWRVEDHPLATLGNETPPAMPQP